MALISTLHWLHWAGGSAEQSWAVVRLLRGITGATLYTICSKEASHSERDFHPLAMRKQAKYIFDVCRMKLDLKSRMLF